MSFKDFLLEVQLPKSQFATALKLIEKIIKRKFGQLFRYGGDNGVQIINVNGKTYEGYLYFLKNKRAFRLNVFRGKITSIDVWKEWHDTFPDFTVDVSDLNSVVFMKILEDVILKIIERPKSGEVPIYFMPEHVQSKGSYLTEAKRSNPLEFFELCKSTLGNVDFTKLDWQQINSVAEKHDVQVPTVIRGQKSGKGTWSVVPPGVNAKTSEVEDKKELEQAEKKGSDPILFLKITAQDPVSKKFIPVGEVKQAQDLYKKINDMVGDSNDEIPSDDELRDPDTQFGHLAKLTRAVAKGAIPSLLVYGGPGTGKTYTITEILDESGKPYVKFSGKASPAAIYQILFRNRKEGNIIVFDDLDSIWSSEDAVNVLKAGLDTKKVREISWASKLLVDVSKMDKRERENFNDKLDTMLDIDPTNPKAKLPNQFIFQGAIIFISNLAKKDFDTAILSRSAKIEINLSSQEILERMRRIIDKLGDPDISVSTKNEIIDVLVSRNKQSKLEMVTMREFIKAQNIYKSGDPDWKELLAYM